MQTENNATNAPKKEFAGRIAIVCHEVNRSYCQAMGDNSQPSWNDAPEWQKNSAINGVMFHLNNPGATPENSHESWLKQKAEEGWKYGPVKNPETKEHPCFVPYAELPVEQKAKDYLFGTTVHQVALAMDLASAIGYEKAINSMPASTGEKVSFEDKLKAVSEGENVENKHFVGVMLNNYKVYKKRVFGDSDGNKEAESKG